MADLGDLTVSNAALLELKDEHEVFRQGHRFLDEKRMLVAQELLRQVENWRRLHAACAARREAAREAVRGAIRERGFEGVQLAEVGSLAVRRLKARERQFLGVALLEGEVVELHPEPLGDRLQPCRDAFVSLAQAESSLAVCAANIERLIEDYVRTERRTRALEDILLPELEQALDDMESKLEENERDEITRVRWFSSAS